jgi:hypothetical protein
LISGCGPVLLFVLCLFVQGESDSVSFFLGKQQGNWMFGVWMMKTLKISHRANFIFATAIPAVEQLETHEKQLASYMLAPRDGVLSKSKFLPSGHHLFGL